MLIFPVTSTQWLFELMCFTVLTKFQLELPNKYMTGLHTNNQNWYEIRLRCQQTMGKGESADHH